MASVSGWEADFMKSMLGIVAEHAPSVKPYAMTAINRFMIPHPWAA